MCLFHFFFSFKINNFKSFGYTRLLNYSEEFEYFMSKLKVSDLKSLVFLSATDQKEGSRLYSFNLNKNGSSNISTIHEFTIPSLVHNQYSMINVEGLKDDRKIIFQVFNENGSLIYKKNFHQDQLKF